MARERTLILPSARSAQAQRRKPYLTRVLFDRDPARLRVDVLPSYKRGCHFVQPALAVNLAVEVLRVLPCRWRLCSGLANVRPGAY